MARASFGGGASDFTFSSTAGGIVRVNSATLTMWDAETAGTRITDLQRDGQPTDTIAVGPDGKVPTFQGPDGVLDLWADAGGDRVQLVAQSDAVARAESAAAAAQQIADDIPDQVEEVAAPIAEAAVDEHVAGLSLPTFEKLGQGQLGQTQPSHRVVLGYKGNREAAQIITTAGVFDPPVKVETDLALLREEVDISCGVRIGFAYRGNRELAAGQFINGTGYGFPSAAGPAKSPVVIEGDSLTENWATSTGALGVLLGRSVIARGRGGQGSRYIAARQGGQPFRVTLTGNSIPASTAATSCTIAYPTAGAIAMPVSTHLGVLAGVPGTLAITADLTGTFTPTNAPSRAIPVAPGTPFVAGLADRALGCIPIPWLGRNNYQDSGAAAQIISDIRATLDWFGNPKDYIVPSILPSASETPGSGARTTLDSVNAAIRDAFPAHWEDVATRLRSTALITAAGGTPTSQDTTDIGNAVTPQTLRAELSPGVPDPLHLGAIGYAALNILITETFTARGL